MSSSPVDSQTWLYLDPIRAMDQIGDTQVLRSMLPMLQELLEREVPQITQLLAAEDVRGANPLLRSLKGCLAIFCSAALCEELAKIEHMSKSCGIGEVGPAFMALSTKLDHLQREVARFQALPA